MARSIDDIEQGLYWARLARTSAATRVIRTIKGSKAHAQARRQLMDANRVLKRLRNKLDAVRSK